LGDIHIAGDGQLRPILHDDRAVIEDHRAREGFIAAENQVTTTGFGEAEGTADVGRLSQIPIGDGKHHASHANGDRAVGQGEVIGAGKAETAIPELGAAGG